MSDELEAMRAERDEWRAKWWQALADADSERRWADKYYKELCEVHVKIAQHREAARKVAEYARTIKRVANTWAKLYHGELKRSELASWYEALYKLKEPVEGVIRELSNQNNTE